MLTYHVIADSAVDAKYADHGHRMLAHAAGLAGLDEWLQIRWFVPEAIAARYQTTGEAFTEEGPILGCFRPKEPGAVYALYGRPLHETLQTVAHEVCHAALARRGLGGMAKGECDIADELAAEAWRTFDPTNGGELADYVMKSLEADKRRAEPQPKPGVKPEILAGFQRIRRALEAACDESIRVATDPLVSMAQLDAVDKRRRDLVTRYNILAEGCGHEPLDVGTPQAQESDGPVAFAGIRRDQSGAWLDSLPLDLQGAFAQLQQDARSHARRPQKTHAAAAWAMVPPSAAGEGARRIWRGRVDGSRAHALAWARRPGNWREQVVGALRMAAEVEAEAEACGVRV